LVQLGIFNLAKKHGHTPLNYT